MSTDVIGSRYRLGSAVTGTPEATTWDARDTWLDQRVLVVTPEPGCAQRFSELAGAVLDRSSAHLVGLYDIGAPADDFVVFGVPATLSDGQGPREEEEILVTGCALGDALEALHERGVVHGDLHPGSVVVDDFGDASLSPWPLAPGPHNWSGPGGFGSDPDEPREFSTRDDVRALGAVLLGALAGPPLFSSQQVGNLERELSGRAPNAVTIADRALTPPARGGYAVAAQLRDDCAAALAGGPVTTSAHESLGAASGIATAAAGARARSSEGRRAALVLAASGAALFAGFWVAGSIGAGPRPLAHAVSAPESSCSARPASPPCAGRERSAAVPSRPAAGAPARFTDNPAAVPLAPVSGASATVATSTPSTSTVAGRTTASTTSTTTASPSTTTSTAPSTSTTTTSTALTTTTTTPASTSTSTSTSSNVVQTGPNGTNGAAHGPGGGPGQGPGT